jgi:hypothetical protein
MMLEFLFVHQKIMTKPTLSGQSLSWTARSLLKRAVFKKNIVFNQKFFSKIFDFSIYNLSHICYNIIVNKSYTLLER